MKTAEVPIRYKDRPEGSTSKLNTIRDGIRILRMIGLLVKEERPLMFFGSAFFLLVLLSVGLATPVVIEYLHTGLVPRFPTAILASAIMLLAFLSLMCGLVLDTVTHSRRELKRLAYLEIAAPRWPSPRAPLSVAEAMPVPGAGRVTPIGRNEAGTTEALLPQPPLTVA